MKEFSLDQQLPPYRTVAHNDATESANKIHDDNIARRYGFAGGLVPGVSDYAYMTRPLVEALGREWLDGGWMEAKLLKPLYDGDRVEVRGRVSGLDPLELSLELVGPKEAARAVASAGVGERHSPPTPEEYPQKPLPDFEDRPSASLDALPAGTVLGTWEASLEDLVGELPQRFADTLPLYSGPEAVVHPAFLPHLANEILHHNVKLGPWIHSGSAVQHYALPEDGEGLALRGKVKKPSSKRGHDFVVLDLALFGRGLRPLARIEHNAIIRPRLA